MIVSYICVTTGKKYLLTICDVYQKHSEMGEGVKPDNTNCSIMSYSKGFIVKCYHYIDFYLMVDVS